MSDSVRDDPGKLSAGILSVEIREEPHGFDPPLLAFG
jgi:hypothetical protein